MQSTSYINPNLFPARCSCLAQINPGNLLFVLASYELGNVYISDGSTYLTALDSLAFPYLFGSQFYQLLNGQLPTAVLGGSLNFIGDATGIESWTVTTFTGSYALQFEVNSGGMYGSNPNLIGLSYVIQGTETFTAYINVQDVTPDEILLQFYCLGAWHAVYWGATENFAQFTGVIPLNKGAVPPNVNQWISLTFSVADLGLAATDIITGITWGVYKSIGTSTVIFSNINSSTQSDALVLTNGFVDAVSDFISQVFLLESPNIVLQFPTIYTYPTSTVLPSSGQVYNALTYNSASGVAYILENRGNIYSYFNGSTLFFAGSPLGVSPPARRLYYSYPNLYTLFPYNNKLGILNVNSTSWSLSGSPFTNSLDELAVSGFVAIGGSNPISIVSVNNNGMAFSSNSSQLLVTDQPTNNIRIYDLKSGGWSLNSTIVGAGASGPTAIAVPNPTTQALVCNPSDNIIQILTYNLGVWSSTNLAVTNPVAIAVTPNGLQALVCNQSANTVQVLDKSGGTWMIAQTILGIPNPSSIAITPNGINAGIITSAGITFLTYNGVVWSISNTYIPANSSSIIVSDSISTQNQLLYTLELNDTMVRTTIFENGQFLDTSGNFFISPGTPNLVVINSQIFLVTSNGNLYAGWSINNTVIFGFSPINTVLNGVSSVLFIANPTNFTNLVLIGNATSIAEYYNNASGLESIPIPSLINTANSLVAVLSGGSWVTTDLQNRNRISAITITPNEHIYAATTDNNIYKIFNNLVVAGYPYLVPEPTDQYPNVPLGLSKLIFYLNKLYATSSLYGGLIVINNV